MSRAFEMDEKGRTILSFGIPIGQPAPRLQIADLQIGDVLVWYSDSPHWITATIEEISHGPISHSGIYVGSGFSVDAGPRGVTRQTVATLMNDFAYGRIMRSTSLDAAKRQQVASRALSFVGRRYAWIDAMLLPIRRRAYYHRYDPYKRGKWPDPIALLGRTLIACRRRFPPSTGKSFCSRIVIEAYAAIDYFPEWHVVDCAHTPYDLGAESFFEEAGWLSNASAPVWHRMDPYSPNRVTQRTWTSDLKRIFKRRCGHSVRGDE